MTLKKMLLCGGLLLILAACSTTTPDPIATDSILLETALAQPAAATKVPTEGATITLTPSETATATDTPSPTVTPSATASATPSPSLTATPSDTASATIAASPTASQTPIVIAARPTQEPSLPPDTKFTPGAIPSAAPRAANPSPTQFVINAPTLPPVGVIPTNTPRISPTPSVVPGDHFWFWRPFPRDPSGQVSDVPARGYSYGSSSGGALQVHHGIDIQNPTGTRVQAIGSGAVFYAGGDIEVVFGPQPDFYGNVVVIEHDFLAPNGEKLYSLYGHLSRVAVAAGDAVGYGSNIGAVGAEGVAFGPHLHLEIRIGDPYSYTATYNPELWTLPWENYGVLAARIVDASGQPVKGARVELIGRGDFISGWSYESDLVNSDPFWGENLVIGDIRAGQYDLKVGEIRNIQYRDVVFIQAGVVNFIEIQINQ